MKPRRLLLGACVSLALAALTLSRVDVASTARAVAAVTPLALCLGLVFASLEILVRAWRWRYVLSALGPVSYGRSLAYTLVGAFGNLLLPARLGDLAKAYLAANAIGLPRMATLGSVGTERVVDGLTTISLAAILGLAVPSLPPAVAATLPLSLVGVAVAVVVALALRQMRRRRRGPRPLQLFLAWLSRLAPGAKALTSVRGSAVVIASTLVAYGCAVMALYSIGVGVGLHLTVLGAAFAMAWIALSTAVPAGPGSVGTYEFVGVTVLTAVNQDPSAALAAVVLLHIVGTIPPALAGLVAALVLHVKLLDPESPASGDLPQGSDDALPGRLAWPRSG